MIRFLVAIASILVIGAATHANVMHAGGYQSADAPLIITIAGLLALGMCFAGMIWREGSWLWALMLTACLISGELYWLGTNAEREFASREEVLQPMSDALALKTKLTARLDKAEQAKDMADAAKISEAAKSGCRKECRILLEGTASEASRELEEARRTLDALPPIHTGERLAEKLGMNGWTWDILMAGLRSLAVMGGSIALGLVLHRPDRTPRVRKVTPVSAQPHPVDITPPACAIEPPKRSNVVQINPIKELATFATSHVKKAPDGMVSMRDVLLAYEHYCATEMLAPLDRKEFVSKFADLCERAGVTVKIEGRDAYLVGARLIA